MKVGVRTRWHVDYGHSPLLVSHNVEPLEGARLLGSEVFNDGGTDGYRVTPEAEAEVGEGEFVVVEVIVAGDAVAATTGDVDDAVEATLLAVVVATGASAYVPGLSVATARQGAMLLMM
jgi:hypothetical protein